MTAPDKIEDSVILKSQNLLATIKKRGAELRSLKLCQTDFEFVWPARPDVWSRHAPVLFPIVGKLNNNQIHINGQAFNMSQHGFARDCVFEITAQTADSVTFRLSWNKESLTVYPFRFQLSISYTLIYNKLIMEYRVENTDTQPIFFSIGAHPGFCLPVTKLNEYYIEFETEEPGLERHLLNEGLFNRQTEPLLLDKEKRLWLSRTLFDKDAIVLKELRSKNIRLKHSKSRYEIKMYYPDFSYLGIWSKKGCEEFLCLEPWSGIADYEGFTGDISEKEGIESLKAGESKSFKSEFYLNY